MKRALHAFGLVLLVLSACARPASPVSQNSSESTPIQTTALPAAATFTATPPRQVFLSDLEPLAASVGAGSLGRGVYPAMEGMPGGSTIQADGASWPHGLFAHAPSRLEYALDGQYSQLSGSLLMHDQCRVGDGAVFHVIVDNRDVYTSPFVTYSSMPIPFQVDLSGGQILILMVDKLSTGDCDWSIWGDPVLLRADHAITATPDPNLPCALGQPERVYLFLDCTDVRRMRALLNERDAAFLAVWNQDLNILDGYRRNLPKTYNNLQSAPALWSGQMNYYLRDLTLVYLVTGQQEYADDLGTMLDLLETSVPHTSRPFDYNDIAALVAHPKHGAIPGISVLFAYMALRDTGRYTDEHRQKMDAFMILQGETALTAIPVLGGHVGLDSSTNRNVMTASAILATVSGAAFPDDPRAQTLYRRARNELDWMLANWWQPDGGWGEDTDSYGFSRLDSLLLTAEAVRKNLGDDLFTQDFQGQTLDNLCRYYLRVLTPEGVPPALNDSTHFMVDPGVLRLCAYRANDPQLAWAAGQYRWGIENAYGQPPIQGANLFFNELAWSGLPPSPQSPDFTSLALNGTGAVILRSGWAHTDSYMMLQYTRSRVHAEKAFGTLYLFDGGPWMVANGYHLPSFNMDNDSQTYDEGQSTQQHNTLSLDKLSQTNIGGSLAFFADLDRVGAVSVQGQPYGFASFSRSVLWMKEWHQWLVVDDVGIHDGGVHSLQLRWYVRSDNRGFPSAANPADWQFSRSTGTPRTLEVALFPSKPAAYQTIQRLYPYEEWISNAQGVEMDQAGLTGSVRTVTALTAAANVPTVTRVDEVGGTRLQAVYGEESWTWLLPLPGKDQLSLTDAELNGSAGCKNYQGSELQGYCLVHGTRLVDGSQTLVESQKPISVEADFPAGCVTFQSEEVEAIDLFWPVPISTIQLDGTRLPFSIENGMLHLSLPSGSHILNLH